MMLNGGQLYGRHLLSRVTVAYMTSDHQDTIEPAMPTLQPGSMFGLGFAVRKGAGVNSAVGSVGEYKWGGAAGTGFWVDPKEQMLTVVMTQTAPGCGIGSSGVPRPSLADYVTVRALADRAPAAGGC